MLHSGEGRLELLRQPVPEVASDVPRRQLGGVVAECVAIWGTESAR